MTTVRISQLLRSCVECGSQSYRKKAEKRSQVRCGSGTCWTRRMASVQVHVGKGN